MHFTNRWKTLSEEKREQLERKLTEVKLSGVELNYCEAIPFVTAWTAPDQVMSLIHVAKIKLVLETLFSEEIRFHGLQSHQVEFFVLAPELTPRGLPLNVGDYGHLASDWMTQVQG